MSVDVVPLGSAVKPNRPRVKPLDLPNLPFIGMEHVEAHTMKLLGTVPAGTMKSASVHFRPGDVLYGRLRPYLNKVYRPSFEGLCSAEFIVFPESERVHGSYLQYFLNSAAFTKFASDLNAGDRPRVDFEQLASFPFPLPSLNDQRRIVAEIEKQFSRLDEAVANLQRVKGNLKRYKASVLKAAVEGSLLPKAGEWHRTCLGDVASIIDPQPSHRTPAIYLSGIPYVGLGDINDHEEIDFENARKVSPDILIEHQARYTLKNGDFVFGKIGTIGRPARLRPPFNYALSANVVLIQPDPLRLFPAFAFALLSSPQIARASATAASATTQAAFGIKRIRQLEVKIPPLSIQREVAQEIDRRLSFVREVEAEIDANFTRARKLRQSLLRRAFSSP